ncbi:hypothetical protein HY213_03180 [Candidatus Peregrinibacteria bacterium]|nr:hypothetical protein [Candidatus Peregrinibacteria bacterium]
MAELPKQPSISQRCIEQCEILYVIAARWQRVYQQRFVQLLGSLCKKADEDHLYSVSDKQLGIEAVKEIYHGLTCYSDDEMQQLDQERDCNRISQIVERIRGLWESLPHERLGKLVVDTIEQAGGDPADSEDTDEDQARFGPPNGVSLEKAIRNRIERWFTPLFPENTGEGVQLSYNGVRGVDDER